MSRTFTSTHAKRERVPMLVGLVGPSASGKTMSALRLAKGMQRVTGGKIYFIDTEARRALHYADDFDFEHVDFQPPYSPGDYRQVIEQFAQNKDDIIIVDSMSHEHEGPGGLLEMHEAELDRMAGSDWKKRDRVKFAAWIKPKAERRKLINTILRIGVNAVFCFRAKEKTKPQKGGEPLSLGWQAIAGEEFVYEMLVNCLLYPNAKGVPNWNPDRAAEDATTKKPDHLAHVFKDGEPLSEEVGEGIARWAAGEGAKGDESQGTADIDSVIEHLRNAPDRESLDSVMNKWAKMKWSDEEKGWLRAAVTSRRQELENDSA